MSLTGKSNEEKIWNYLLAAGMSKHGAAGVMGNLYAESGLSPINLQNTSEKKLGMTDAEYTAAVDNGTYTNFAKDSGGYGLAQWTYHTRKQALLDFAKSRGASVGDLETQLAFLVKELGQYGLLNSLKTVDSVREASNTILLKFEKPASMNTQATQDRRAGYAQGYFDKYAGAGSAGAASEASAPAAAKGTSADIVLAVAVGQIGYKEKATKANLDDKDTNAGHNNWTKYARDFDEKYPNWYNGKKNGYAWCDMFVDWCFLTAFGYETALKLLCQPERSAGAGCTYSLKYYRDKGQFHTSGPRPGDQIFFGTSLSASGHTGIVERVDSSKVYTIEGNTSDMVARRTYSLTDKTILGYGRPAYDTVSAATQTPAPVPVQQTTQAAGAVKVEAAHNFDKAVAGAYTVTTGLNLRAGSGTNKAVLVVMPKGAVVRNYGYFNIVDGTKWLYVQYTAGGKTYTGFCSSKYLAK